VTQRAGPAGAMLDCAELEGVAGESVVPEELFEGPGDELADELPEELDESDDGESLELADEPDSVLEPQPVSRSAVVHTASAAAVRGVFVTPRVFRKTRSKGASCAGEVGTCRRTPTT
jgi:hypothetical protein